MQDGLHFPFLSSWSCKCQKHKPGRFRSWRRFSKQCSYTTTTLVIWPNSILSRNWSWAFRKCQKFQVVQPRGADHHAYSSHWRWCKARKESFALKVDSSRQYHCNSDYEEGWTKQRHKTSFSKQVCSPAFWKVRIGKEIMKSVSLSIYAFSPALQAGHLQWNHFGNVLSLL